MNLVQYVVVLEMYYPIRTGYGLLFNLPLFSNWFSHSYFAVVQGGVWGRVGAIGNYLLYRSLDLRNYIQTSRGQSHGLLAG